MLATLGLGRLEKVLAHDPAPADALQLPAATRPALTGRHHAETSFAADVSGRIESGLPTRMQGQYRTNTQFTVIRHVNRV
ncbi:hypothetical protein [Mycobacterium asiaticum]